MTSWQISQPQLADPQPDQMFHSVAQRFEHAPNLAVDALSQHQPKPRRREGPKTGYSGTFAVEHDAAEQLVSKGGVPRLVQSDLIFLVHLESRMSDSLRQVAFICQHQQTFGLSI